MEGELVVRDEQPGTQLTPMAMINLAVSQGADVEKIGKLMELQERWEKGEARKAFVVALNGFKANPPKILKTKEVSFGSGAKTAYKHATLDNASEKIGEALSEHGISHRWKVEQQDGRIRVTCILQHLLGHSEEVTLEAAPDTSGSKNSIQAVGSTVSYLQRYTLFAATGLASKSDDDDGRGGVAGLSDNVVADFNLAIEELTDIPAAEKLWQRIAATCSAAGDVPNYDTLKTAMAKKRKALAPKDKI